MRKTQAKTQCALSTLVRGSTVNYQNLAQCCGALPSIDDIQFFPSHERHAESRPATAPARAPAAHHAHPHAHAHAAAAPSSSPFERRLVRVHEAVHGVVEGRDAAGERREVDPREGVVVLLFVCVVCVRV